jgi:hypothetical protein
MIRILMNITNCSPFLQTVSGEILVESIDYRYQEEAKQVKKLLECEFTKKPGSTGYKNPKGYDAAIFEGIKDKLDTMIHSYARGMILAPHNYSWVEDSADIPVEDWIKEKKENHEENHKLEHGRS